MFDYDQFCYDIGNWVYNYYQPQVNDVEAFKIVCGKVYADYILKNTKNEDIFQNQRCG